MYSGLKWMTNFITEFFVLRLYTLVFYETLFCLCSLMNLRFVLFVPLDGRSELRTVSNIFSYYNKKHVIIFYLKIWLTLKNSLKLNSGYKSYVDDLYTEDQSPAVPIS